jgi:hypothetical protein
METNQIIIIICAVAIVAAILLGFLNKDIRVTIKMEDEGYPIQDDGVEELEVKPKRKYTKRKVNVAKSSQVTKRSVGRPRKVN